MLRIATRKSPLALVQVQEILRSLGNPASELIALDSFGDIHKELSLLTPQSPDFFTDTIDRALLDNHADCAVHSAKDLPFPLRSGLELAAITTPLDSTDALVSKNGLLLGELPRGSRIGTSSPQRKKQLVGIREDVSIVSLRGTIQERLAYIDRDEADAVIVATCALKRLGLENRITEILPFKTHPLQGMLAVVVRSNERYCYSRFASLDARLTWGKVWIIGGGPGDPSLITKKGEHILSRAEVIVHDDLVSKDLIDSFVAEKIPVGKRKGQHSSTQNEINELLYTLALSGKRVVRLKGGDSLIFGRSGEELDYLQERHIAVELVPGISSVQGAAAELLMSLTKRGACEHLLLSTAHRAEGDTEDGTTHAVYMGASVKSDVMRRLSEEMGGGANVALIQSATLPNSRVEILPVNMLDSSKLDSPLMIIAGKGVSANVPKRTLHIGLDPVEPPVGGVTIHWPLIRVDPVVCACPRFESFDCILFTSRVSADIFFRRYGLPELPMLAIGKGTREVILGNGGRVAGESERPDSDSLNEFIKREKKWKSILYPCSDRSQNALHENPAVKPLILYRTLSIKRDMIDLSGFDAIVFSSPSTVDAFFSMYTVIPSHLLIYVHGPMTAVSLTRYGVPNEEIINVQIARQGRFYE